MDGLELQLRPSVRIRLDSITMRSMKELDMIKSFVMAHESFRYLLYIFNKKEDGSPLCQDDRINSCRWGLKDESPTVTICHPKALLMASEIRDAFATLGIDTSVQTMIGRVDVESSNICIAKLDKPLLFKSKQLKKWTSLEESTEKVKFINDLVRQHFKDELTAQGAHETVLAECERITLAGNKSDIEAMLSDTNFYIYTTSQSKSKANVNNQGGRRWGFKTLTATIPFELDIKNAQIGYFKNIGFGRVFVRG